MEVQEFECECEQKKMNELLSQIAFTSNKEKEKINYLNYSPLTTDESSSDMSCKFISCLMLVLVRILCSVIIICFSTCIFLIICIFVVEELVFLIASEKCCKKPKLMISNNILFKCLECRRYFTNAWKSICHVRREFIHNNYAHLFM